MEEIKQRWLRPKQAAEYLGIARSTLARMRSHETGPVFSRLAERCVVYDIEELDRFLEARKNDA